MYACLFNLSILINIFLKNIKINSYENDGVTAADWNQETMMLAIEFDADKVNLDHVHKIIAEAGHDTEKYRAKDEVYQGLPACCHYERPAKDQTKESDKSQGSCCSQ